MPLPSSFILVRNKSFKLWKRSDSPTAPWWVRLQINGVRTAISTKTADLLSAQHRATSYIESALDGDLTTISAQITPRTTKAATIGEIIAALNASPIKSAPRYTRALLDLVTKAKSLPSHKATAQPSSILNTQLVNAFQAGASPDSHSSLNTILRNAQSCFSKTALTFFEKQSIPLPDLSSFLSAPELPDEGFRYSDTPITPKQLKALASLTIPPNLSLLHQLVCLCGLSTNDSTHATVKDFAPGGKFFRRFPTPDIPLPKKGPLFPHLKTVPHHNDFVHLYKSLLAPLKLTPQHLRWHAAHTWLNRSGSIDSAAQFLNISTTWATYHLANLSSTPPPLTWPELLGK